MKSGDLVRLREDIFQVARDLGFSKDPIMTVIDPHAASGLYVDVIVPDLGEIRRFLESELEVISDGSNILEHARLTALSWAGAGDCSSKEGDCK